jgi:hypothetical protein
MFRQKGFGLKTTGTTGIDKHQDGVALSMGFQNTGGENQKEEEKLFHWLGTANMKIRTEGTSLFLLCESKPGTKKNPRQRRGSFHYF